MGAFDGFASPQDELFGYRAALGAQEFKNGHVRSLLNFY
jgi:hypothetical protein